MRNALHPIVITLITVLYNEKKDEQKKSTHKHLTLTKRFQTEIGKETH